MRIQWVDVDGLSAEVRTAVEERLRRLNLDDGDLLSVRISAKSSLHHRHGSKHVRITSLVRRREIVASRERPDLGLALNEALDDFEREVHARRERLRDERARRPAHPPHLGIVERILAAQGYGFVLTDAGERVYFHRNAVTGGLDFDALREGQRVGLQVEAGEKGLQATSVVPLPPDAPMV
jgi:cold shock CspA family protein/ribosome-associated translation inhibitor RaiA